MNTLTDPNASFADKQVIEQALTHVFAPWVRVLDLHVIEARRGEVTLALALPLPMAPQHARECGVLCGQTILAAGDRRR